ncbi:hypothetical protein Tco_0046571 [Tanacetum coccineum]
MQKQLNGYFDRLSASINILNCAFEGVMGTYNTVQTLSVRPYVNYMRPLSSCYRELTLMTLVRLLRRPALLEMMCPMSFRDPAILSCVSALFCYHIPAVFYRLEKMDTRKKECRSRNEASGPANLLIFSCSLLWNAVVRRGPHELNACPKRALRDNVETRA